MVMEYQRWILSYMNPYADLLVKRYDLRKIGHKKFEKSLDKLDEWVQHYADQFGIDEEEEEFE